MITRKGIAHMDSQADHDTVFEAALRAVAAVRHLDSSIDRMTALQIAWFVVAHEARGLAMPEPGGFLDEQVRQLEQLDRLSDLVRDEVPDDEYARLCESDWRAIFGRVAGALSR